MKTNLTILLVLFSITVFGQTDSILLQLNAPRNIVDCEVVSMNAADLLCKHLIQSNLDSMDLISNQWISLCGLSECTQRLIILKSIIQQKNSSKSINDYFENGFHFKYLNRVFDSRKMDFGYLYSLYKPYYGYIPLRHPIDSVVSTIAVELIKKGTLTPDEKLMCILFSGDIKGFDEEREKSDYKNGVIQNFMVSKKKEYKNSMIGYSVYAGINFPIGKEGVFGNNPVIGFRISSPLEYKYLLDLGFSFTINNNSKSYQYFAFEDTNSVELKSSFFVGAFVGYKLIENKQLMLIPKFGLGIEIIDTGLSKKVENTEQIESKSIETANLSLGLTAIIPMAKNDRLGVALTYHFCPYNQDENLITKFDQSALRFEVFFRF